MNHAKEAMRYLGEYLSQREPPGDLLPSALQAIQQAETQYRHLQQLFQSFRDENRYFWDQRRADVESYGTPSDRVLIKIFEALEVQGYLVDDRDPVEVATEAMRLAMASLRFARRDNLEEVTKAIANKLHASIDAVDEIVRVQRRAGVHDQS